MPGEIICIRRLTRSDLGWFAAHRSTVASKQRAVNINADIAEQLVDRAAWQALGLEVPCKCIYPGAEHTQNRRLWKVGKNWRFGGPKLDGAIFRNIREGDFFILRSPLKNSGTRPVTLTFASATADPALHAWLTARTSTSMHDNMMVAVSGNSDFSMLASRLFGDMSPERTVSPPSGRTRPVRPAPSHRTVPPMPRDEETVAQKPRTLHERIRSPHILSQMLKVSSDLSAEAQYEFMKVLEILADQLRQVLLAAGMITRIEKDHGALWRAVKDQDIAFVDGGMANLSMLGSAPIAARVGSYVVTPGRTGTDREQFIMVKHLIDELYSPVPDNGVFAGLFPDPGPLRDAARISVEAAGGVQVLVQNPNIRYLFLHGSLVSPVSRYTDLMDGGQVLAPFPNFSANAQKVLLPEADRGREGKDANFIRVYLRQLELLQQSSAVVCGVVERETQAASVYRRLIDFALEEPSVAPLLPKAPGEWAAWFDRMVEQFRINDALLFRCVLQPGEVTVPVDIDRNELRRAPSAWISDIQRYPKPWAAYLLPTEWGNPVRVEIFEKDKGCFSALARLVMHCAWLLPRYAFPVGLDIADKYAKVPNWMTRPVNTNTAVKALRQAMDTGDATTFNAMRRMLCGSTRDWLFRPKAF